MASWLKLPWKKSVEKKSYGLFIGGRPNFTARQSENMMRAAYEINSVGYTAISQIAAKCTEIIPKVYELSKSGKPREIKNHPALALLYKPNPEMTYSDLVTAWMSYYQLDGNAYLFGEWVKNLLTGQREKSLPKYLWVLNPVKVKPEIKRGSLFVDKYIYKENDIERIFVKDQVTGECELLHSKMFNPFSPFVGFSPLQAALMALDSHNKSSIWNISLLDNKAMPSGIVFTEGSLTDEQVKQMKEDVRNSYQGYMNTGDPMVFQGGAKFESVALSPEEMHFLEGKNVNAKDICLALKFPPILLGIKGDSTYNNLTEANTALVTRTCVPYMKIFFQQLTKYLLEPENPNLYFEPCEDYVYEIVEARRARNDAIDKMASLTVDEKRLEMGLDPYQGSGADKILVNSSLIFLDDVAIDMDAMDDSDSELLADDESDSDEDADDKSIEDALEFKGFNLTTRKQKLLYQRQFHRKQIIYQRLMSNDFAKFFKKQGKKISQELESLAQSGEKSVSKYSDVVDRLLNDDDAMMKKVFDVNYRKTLKAFGKSVFSDARNSLKSLNVDTETKSAAVRFEDFVVKYIESQSAKKIKIIDQNTKNQLMILVRASLQEAVEDGATELELGEQIEKLYSNFSSSRARTIARTETNQASNVGSREAVKSLRLPNVKKEWVDAGDDRVRDGKFFDIECEHKASADHTALRGKSIPIGDKFLVPGTGGKVPMDGPGDPNAPAEQLVNCRCVQVYNTGD